MGRLQDAINLHTFIDCMVCNVHFHLVANRNLYFYSTVQSGRVPVEYRLCLECLEADRCGPDVAGSPARMPHLSARHARHGIWNADARFAAWDDSVDRIAISYHPVFEIELDMGAEMRLHTIEVYRLPPQGSSVLRPLMVSSRTIQ